MVLQQGLGLGCVSALMNTPVPFLSPVSGGLVVTGGVCLL